MEGTQFDYFLTLTTRQRFDSVDTIKAAIRQRKRFLAALYYTTGGKAKYVWVIGITKRGYIHFHLLVQGPQPSKRWLKDAWYKLSGSFNAKVTPVCDEHEDYLFKNIRQLPGFEDDARFSLGDIRALEPFHRIGASKGFIPSLKSKKQSGRYVYLTERAVEQRRSALMALVRRKQIERGCSLQEAVKEVAQWVRGLSNGPQRDDVVMVEAKKALEAQVQAAELEKKPAPSPKELFGELPPERFDEDE